MAESVKHCSCLIFDLDGTLSNPLRGMVDAINHALKAEGFAARSAEELAHYVGPPLEGTLSDLTGSEDPDLINRLVVGYRNRYLASGYKDNELYPGIQQVLQQLLDRGIRLGVCTSKPEPTARLVLDHFAIEQCFDFVSGGDVGVTKIQQLQELLENSIIDQRAIMIGDRSNDMQAACQNGLTAAGVLWGFGAVDELESARADLLLTCPEEILKLCP